MAPKGLRVSYFSDTAPQWDPNYADGLTDQSDMGIV